MTVKPIARTLDLIEIFSLQQRPMTLTEIANALAIPMSSCLGIIRTLVNKGYLYEIRKRGGYYPTRKLYIQLEKINAGDPLSIMVHDHLVELVKEVDETVVLGRLVHNKIVYLDVVSSNQAIRYFSEVGEERPLHANSIGRAIMAQMDEQDVLLLLKNTKLERLTDLTITSPQALIAALAKTRHDGWGENIGDSVSDLAAMAMAFAHEGEWYGVSIVGPLQRMQQKWASFEKPLKKSIQKICSEIGQDQTA